MTDAATTHSHHESSPWPMVVGLGVLLTPLALLTAFTWEKPVAGIVLFGIVMAILAVGLAGWAREAFTEEMETEPGLGPIAVAAFILSETIIFGCVFVAFWLGRIENFAEWGTYIPEGLEASFAVWLTFILWASSITIMLSEKAFEGGDRTKALMWLGATFALGTLFVVLHMNEWAHLVDEGFTVGSNNFASSFYALTGVHTSHVIVGLFIHAILFYVVMAGLMKENETDFYKGAALYWHFVDIMWLLVAANAYLIGGTP